MDFKRSQKPSERSLQPSQQRTTANLGAPTAFHSPSEKHRKFSGHAVLTLLVVGIFMISAVAWYMLDRPAEPRGDRYQAIFLDDNQVFFGKLKNSRGDYLRLENVYSTQADTSSGSEVSPSVSNDISLVKVGDLVYGPEDVMMIRADKVKFWQDLKSDSKISKTIDSQR